MWGFQNLCERKRACSIAPLPTRKGRTRGYRAAYRPPYHESRPLPRQALRPPQLLQRFSDVRQPEHGVPPEPTGAMLADFMNPAIVGAAEGILEFDVGRESGVQERGIDDLGVDAEFVEIANSRIDIG